MAHTREKRRQNRTHCSQLDNTTDDFKTRSFGTDAQKASELDRVDQKLIHSSLSHLMTESSSEINMQKHLKRISLIKCKMLLLRFLIRVQEVILLAMHNVVFRRVKVLIRLTNNSSERNPIRSFSEPD